MRERRTEHGAVMVEFALVLVPLLLIVVGFLQIGIMMHAKINGTHLTAEGARYVAVNQNPGLTDPSISPKTLQNYIRNRAGTNFLKTATVCIDYPVNPVTSTSGKVGDPVRVRLDRAYGLQQSSDLADLAGGVLPVSVNVHSETTMRLEALPSTIPAGCLT